MLYMVKLQKGEIWKPEQFDLRTATVRVAKGNAWVTFNSSNEDLIFREGETLSLNEKAPVVQALSHELDLQIQFIEKAKKFFR